MKNLLLLSAFTIFFSACGPAAEDRQVMHARAKVFQDSIANALRIAIQEAEVPANTAVKVDTPAVQVKPNAPAPASSGAPGSKAQPGAKQGC
jgi:hypothetical protein